MWTNLFTVGCSSRGAIKLLFLVTKPLNCLRIVNSFQTKAVTNYVAPICCNWSRPFYSSVLRLQENAAVLIKKRPVRKKVLLENELPQPGFYKVVAFSTAQEYDLEALKEGLTIQNLYEPKNIDNLAGVLYAVAKYEDCKEPCEIFFFREGSIVFWNIGDVESGNMIDFVKRYEKDRYSYELIQGEVELMKYRHQLDGKSTIIQNTGELFIAPNDNILEKYTFSNAIVSSVKLGIWEATLDKFIDSIEYVTSDLKKGANIKMPIEEVLRRYGELYGLRHLINLSSDLLDTPDFYWEHEKLEQFYLQGCAYFSITRRTKVINEKINHCIELIELLSTHLSDKHHVRLEWMVIVLITLCVFFETLHYIHKYL